MNSGQENSVGYNRQLGPLSLLLVHGAFDRNAFVPPNATTQPNETMEIKLGPSPSIARPSVKCILSPAPVDPWKSCSSAVPVSADQSRLLKVTDEVEGFVAARNSANAARSSFGPGTTSPAPPRPGAFCSA